MSAADFKQAERLLGDGPVNIVRMDDQYISIAVTTDREEEYMMISYFNAARVVGMLATVLGMDLPSDLARKIKL